MVKRSCVFKLPILPRPTKRKDKITFLRGGGVLRRIFISSTKIRSLQIFINAHKLASLTQIWSMLHVLYTNNIIENIHLMSGKPSKTFPLWLRETTADVHRKMFQTNNFRYNFRLFLKNKFQNKQSTSKKSVFNVTFVLCVFFNTLFFFFF